MKIRTTYFKTPDMSVSTKFWKNLLGFEPHKKSDFWTEFACENMNFALLFIEDFEVAKTKEIVSQYLN